MKIEADKPLSEYSVPEIYAEIQGCQVSSDSKCRMICELWRRFEASQAELAMLRAVTAADAPAKFIEQELLIRMLQGELAAAKDGESFYRHDSEEQHIRRMAIESELAAAREEIRWRTIESAGFRRQRDEAWEKLKTQALPEVSK